MIQQSDEKLKKITKVMQNGNKKSPMEMKMIERNEVQEGKL